MSKSVGKHRIGAVLREYAIITFGVLLVAIGVYFFKFPSRISTGGVTGLAIVLEQIIPKLSASDIVSIFNVAFLVVGFIVLGREFGIKTVYGSLLLSGFLELFDLLFDVFSVPADVLPLTGEPVLELFFAVAFPSAGAAILFYNHASTGGTDVAAMIIHKYTSLDSGKALLVADVLLVLLTFYDFGAHRVDWQTGLLSMAGLLTKSLVVDGMIASINQSKYFLVITTHREEVVEYITKKLKRGATVWQCEGAFTHKEESALVAVMSRSQGYRLRQYIKTVDPMAFVIITNSSDIVGKGFREV